MKPKSTSHRAAFPSLCPGSSTALCIQAARRTWPEKARKPGRGRRLRPGPALPAAFTSGRRAAPNWAQWPGCAPAGLMGSTYESGNSRKRWVCSHPHEDSQGPACLPTTSTFPFTSASPRLLRAHSRCCLCGATTSNSPITPPPPRTLRCRERQTCPQRGEVCSLEHLGRTKHLPMPSTQTLTTHNQLLSTSARSPPLS